MSEAQDQWQQWLDQGYIEYEGWVPATAHQGQTVRDYGLSPGTAGGSDAGPRRAGGGGLPFRRDPFGGAGVGTSRTGTWEVKNKQDILNYLEFVNRMGVHDPKRREKLGVGDYTSTDVWEFFERPQEMARLESGREGIVSGIERARRGAASEAARRGATRFGEGQSEFQARLPAALASYGGVGAEQALLRGEKRIAEGIEGSAARGSTASNLLAAAERGFGGQMTNASNWAEQGRSMTGAATDTGSSGGAAGGIAAAFLSAIGAPLKIGGSVETEKYRERLEDIRGDLAPVTLPKWSSRIADTTGSPASVGTTESALGQLFPSSGRRRKTGFEYT